MRLARFALAAVLLASGSAASAGEQWVYFGTYTGKGDKDSKGIYRSKFDDATGSLSAPELAAAMDNPSFVNLHPSGKFLYAVGESGGKDGGPVVAFALDAKTGALTKLNEDKSGGPGPCHVAVGPKGDVLAVANYGGGSTCVFAVEADGKVGKRLGFFQHPAADDNRERKEPHAHFCAFNAAGDHLYVTDLGLDRIKVFHIGKKGVEEETDEDITTPPGTGPRHMAFTPVAPSRFYVCGELNSTVNLVKGGKVVQSLSTLPKPTPGNSTAECIVSADSKFVYVSNRGHNSVAIFRVGNDGMLEAAGHLSGGIKVPRNFNIDATGKYMLIANQDGGTVDVWELDTNSGNGKKMRVSAGISKCVCVKFVPVAK